MPEFQFDADDAGAIIARLMSDRTVRNPTLESPIL